MSKALILIILCSSLKACLSADKRPESFLWSTFYLELFARTEISFVDELKLIVNEIEAPTKDVVLHYLKTHQEDTENLLGFDAEGAGLDQKAVSMITNPISLFQFVHRWIHQLRQIWKSLIENAIYHSKFYDREDFQPLKLYEGFTMQDLNSTMEGILNICHVYQLDVSLIVDGVFHGVDIGTKLGADRCFEIGTLGRAIRYYALSIQFYEEALVKSNSSAKKMVKNALNATIKEHDKLVRNKTLHPYKKQYLFDRRLAPLIKRHGEKHKLMRISQRMLVARMSATEIRNNPEKVKSFDIPYADDTCVHKNLQSEADKSSLFCWYEFWIHPYFNINPLKMELHSSKPELVQIYEIISPGQIKRIEETAASRSFENGTSLRNYYGERYLETVHDMDEVRILPLEPKILSYFEPWEPKSVDMNLVHSYTPGSDFKIHMDGFELPNVAKQLQDDFSISILYYLEEPVLGGETAFMYPRITVPPVKGSGLFWINSLTSGNADNELYHASCPLLIGRKIILAKYLYARRPPAKSTGGRTYYFEKLKGFPGSKVLNKKLYPKLRRYLQNEDVAQEAPDYIIS